MKKLSTWFLSGPNRYANHSMYRIEVPILFLSPKQKAALCSTYGTVFSSQKNNVWKSFCFAFFSTHNLSLKNYRTHPSVRDHFIYIAFKCETKERGDSVAAAVKDFLTALARKESFPTLKKYQDSFFSAALGPISTRLITAAEQKNIPSLILNRKPCIIQFGQGHQREITISAVTSKTTKLGARLTADKFLLNKQLRAIDVPVPRSVLIKKKGELRTATTKIGFPLVIKPTDATIGKGVSVNITSQKMAEVAYAFAASFSKKILVEEQIDGHYYRATFIDGEMIACAKSFPVFVTGTGTAKIATLIERANKKNKRQSKDKNAAFYTVDPTTAKLRNILRSQKLTLRSTLLRDKKAFLSFSGADGGEWRDVTKKVHPENIAHIKKALSFANLNIAGVDILSHDISVPLEKNNAKILEINAGPDTNVHMNVSRGGGINIEKAIIKSLFPEKKTGRIPIISITGTNGKTTTAKLLAHILHNPSSRTIGVATSENKYINQKLVRAGDRSGFMTAQSLLKDPTINIAILETCHILGIDRHGLGYDSSDVGIITNIHHDHVGTFCTRTQKDLIDIKSTVARRVQKDGYLIINADDSGACATVRHTKATVAYTSLSKENGLIKKNISEKKPVYYVDRRKVWEVHNKKKTMIVALKNIPIAHNKCASFNVSNILGVIATARLRFAQETSLPQLRTQLASFEL